MFSPVNEKNKAESPSRAMANDMHSSGGISLPAPPLQLRQNVAVNNNKGLEHEADVMGNKAQDFHHSLPNSPVAQQKAVANPVVQRVSIDTLMEVAKLLGLKISENPTTVVIVGAIASAIGLSYGITWGLLSAGLGLTAVALYQKLMQAKPEIKTDVSGLKKTPEGFVDEISSADKNTTNLNLIKPAFPNGWSSDLLLRFGSLNTLTINNPRSGTPPPMDRFSALLKLPIKNLELIRAEFMDEACYQTIGKMRSLQYLSLARTITSEKSPGEATTTTASDGQRELRKVTVLAGGVMSALKDLMENGLKTLDLRWCSALTEENKAALKEIALQHKVTLMLSEK
ncbi:hypothetical protein [Chitinophaga ginsengisegetis]|uniref:hypothetical protein n=1 Tax=Chitinophaga ginsengisegetis TaxID=393003 RepID=UPI000DB96C9C|nr:hypothetical protein [Chitinophaga ginsengisegetis]MDR6565623.1 hypothetical protein [Chitinophaga ginsengisegetis]MDR6645352.1 hypothetical protein [Chitinophaga ginsengisegetis]MDR6652057.1 hypothetical protein [Chitinophaga ginsengisegetis]